MLTFLDENRTTVTAAQLPNMSIASLEQQVELTNGQRKRGSKLHILHIGHILHIFKNAKIEISYWALPLLQESVRLISRCIIYIFYIFLHIFLGGVHIMHIVTYEKGGCSYFFLISFAYQSEVLAYERGFTYSEYNAYYTY